MGKYIRDSFEVFRLFYLLMKEVYLAGDHAGFLLKEKLKKYFEKEGIIYFDLGPLEYSPRDDYPDYIIPLASHISKKGGVGIIIAGSGVGEVMCANKFSKVRATLFHGGKTEIVKVSREHDNSNVLCLGSRFVGFSRSKEAIQVFLNTKFKKGRHSRRLAKFERLGE